MVSLHHASKSTRSRSPVMGKGASLSWLLTMSSFLNFNNGQVQASPLHQQFSRHDDVTYPGEHISWTACGNVTGHLMECSSIDVPIDHFSKENSGNKTFHVSLVRMRGKEATKDSKSILYNPGGPGAGGIRSMFSVGSLLMDIVGEEVNILSFDPRGVNSSTPSASCFATEEIRDKFSATPIENVVTDAPYMSSWAPNFARTCSQNSGEHGKYINTPQVAADMNSILDAIGQEEMYYWGQSYGTLLGQTYATLFPNRSERIVIDGVVNQFQWYEGTLPWMDYQDGKRSLWGFLDECIKAGDAACPLSALSKNTDDLNRMVEEFGNKLKLDQMPVYIDEKHFGSVDYPYVWYSGIVPSLYSYKLWPTLASSLFNAMQGNATQVYEEYGAADLFDSSILDADIDANEGIFFYRLNDGVTGKEYWPQDKQGMVEKLEPFYNTLPFMYPNNPFYWAKAKWTIPRTHNYVPRQGVQTAHPILVMSNTWDPVCALDSARSARDAFEGARLVVVDGYGHCTFTQNSPCANAYIKNYFKNGSMPEQDVTCEVDSGKYFPQPQSA